MGTSFDDRKGTGRRLSERRRQEAPFDGADRRKGERRSPTDRRQRN